MTYDLQGSCILLHGPPKVGKTTLASSFPEPILWVVTEFGHRYIPDHQKKMVVEINSHAQFDEFAKGRGWPKNSNGKTIKPKTIIVDTVANLYSRYKLGVCKDEGCNHPSEKGAYGRTIWDKIGDRFAQGLNNFVQMAGKAGATLVFIDHTKQEDIEIAGQHVTKFMCSMPGQARRWVTPVPDHIWFLGYGDPNSKEVYDDAVTNFRDSRILVLRGGDMVEAGCRDRNMSTKFISNLEEPNHQKKSGGFWQIVKEMSK